MGRGLPGQAREAVNAESDQGTVPKRGLHLIDIENLAGDGKPNEVIYLDTARSATAAA
jgi:hypothetical protein